MSPTQPARIGVIADDLTSAADGAGVFVDAGLECVVGCRGAVPTRGDLRSVDTGSRALDERGAARVTAAAVEALREAEVLYKTVDSTLRGHVAAEIASAFAASGRRRLVFAPAFPAAGRTTVNGVQHIDGVPVTDSVYADDPVHPARSARLAQLVPLGLAPDQVLLGDASTQEELDALVRAERAPREVLWVGSPGMARALAGLFAQSSADAPTRMLLPARRVLIAVGSLNPISRGQVERLRAAGVAVASCDDPKLPVADALCLTTPPAREARAHEAAERLATRAAQCVREGAYDGLIATGGETMELLLKRLEVETVTLEGELAPGFPFGRATRPLSMTLAMKAGGFGDDETLLEALRALAPALGSQQ